MVVVKRGKGESSESVWRKFGRMNYEENLVDELRARKYYKKPSLVRKEEEKLRGKRKVVKVRKPFRKPTTTSTSSKRK
ncbi:30S ribosomal protein S21 [Candidatus Woesebacteria bacterium]|nr:30S ribosomal protein S21 [Candidatus Woesebacteria bacterium]